MKECEKRPEQLSLFVANELDSATQQSVQEHLESCEDCRRQVSFLRGFQSKVAEAEEVAYPSDVHSRLLATLEKEQQNGPAENKVVAFKPRTVSTHVKVTRYLVAAAVLVVCGLG